ncbi:MAG: hypothetical protein NZ850_01600 [Caldimicrobium sp.]|nr:hypothetical protein [Caldimicrobium sp.]
MEVLNTKTNTIMPTFSTKEEIKNFYRERVKKLHPDKGGNLEEYLLLQKWYQFVLKEKENKEKIKVKALKEKQFVKGNSFYKTQRFSIRELALALEKEIHLPVKEVPCPHCQGLGKNRQSKKIPCLHCGELGILKLSSKQGDIIQDCPFCKGLGYFYSESCGYCFGKGRIREEIPLRIKLPPGLGEGDILFISGDSLGTKWNFYIEIEVEPHPLWKLEKDRIVCELRMAFYEILIRDFLEIETLEGKELVPTSLFVKGEPVIFPQRGPFLPDSFWKRGDFVIIFRPLFPKKLSAEAKQLLIHFSKLLEVDYDD